MGDGAPLRVGWLGTDVVFSIVGSPRDVREMLIAANLVGVCKARAARLYREVAALGHGRSGTQALVLALERLSRRP